MTIASHRELDLVVDSRAAGARRALEAVVSALIDARPSQLGELLHLVDEMAGERAILEWLGRLIGVEERQPTHAAQVHAVALAVLSPRGPR